MFKVVLISLSKEEKKKNREEKNMVFVRKHFSKNDFLKKFYVFDVYGKPGWVPVNSQWVLGKS